MNDATRKKLEAAGWTEREPQDGLTVWDWDFEKGDYGALLHLADTGTKWDRPSQKHIAALRAFIEAFEQEGKE